MIACNIGSDLAIVPNRKAELEDNTLYLPIEPQSNPHFDTQRSEAMLPHKWCEGNKSSSF